MVQSQFNRLSLNTLKQDSQLKKFIDLIKTPIKNNQISCRNPKFSNWILSDKTRIQNFSNREKNKN